jgi:hypothetical protein
MALKLVLLSPFLNLLHLFPLSPALSLPHQLLPVHHLILRPRPLPSLPLNSSSRPTSFARQGSLSGSALTHGRGMYTMNNRSCLPYVSNTVIRSAVSFGTRSVSFLLLFSNILLHFHLYDIYYTRTE